VREAAVAILERRYNERGMPLPERLLVESLVEGPEFSVESFGRCILGVTRKHLSALPYFVEVGHDFPAPLPAEQERLVRDEASKALQALGLHWGPAHIEIKLTDQGPRTIEVNPRLAGGFIPELVRLAFGLDVIHQTICAATGGTPDLEPTAHGCSSIRFLIPPGEGILSAVEGLEEARSRSCVVSVQLYASLGQRVSLRGDFRDRVGHVITCAGDSWEAERTAEAARDAVRLVVNGQRG
jgi:S-sulfo-L-cysteine synthase (3-phospho-L-serine-dependent)